jgi:hypothetical protein
MKLCHMYQKLCHHATYAHKWKNAKEKREKTNGEEKGEGVA